MAKTSAKKKLAKSISKSSAKKAPKKAVARLVAKTKKTAPVKSTKKSAKPATKSSAKKPDIKPATPLRKATKKPAVHAILAPVIIKKPIIKTKPRSNYKPARLPAGYKPSDKEPYMNGLQLEYFRQKLLQWREELLAESRETLDHLHEENWHQADIADRASLETEAGVELRTRNRYLKLIAKIDAAIARIESGEYGYCEETGEPIGLKRLEARPVATLSIEAQERHERIEKQYTDEE
ncbi:MAG: RNA polymerase-binding protein DksA [Alphaproteobacteria bacterium]|jgi:DnaK suppressor protein